VATRSTTSTVCVFGCFTELESLEFSDARRMFFFWSRVGGIVFLLCLLFSSKPQLRLPIMIWVFACLWDWVLPLSLYSLSLSLSGF